MTTQDQLKTIVEKLIEQIESNDTGVWIKPWNSTFPMNYSSKRTYNGINVWILWSIAQERNYPTNYWLSFQNIQALGGRINKGEKSTPVFFFKTMTIKEIDEQSGDEVEKTIPLLKSYNIFNIAQTDLRIIGVRYSIFTFYLAEPCRPNVCTRKSISAKRSTR